jgi:methionyl-tRNA formyltransferase
MTRAPNSAPTRVVFAGTPDFAVPSLRALHAGGVTIAGVFTQPDRGRGRGRTPTPSPVKACALELGLPVYQPDRISADPAVIGALSPDLLVVVAYGQILSQAVLDQPRVDVVNVHASLLPRWRGAAPIQRAIEAGDAQTGVAIMRVVHALDAGPVFHSLALPITPDHTAATLHDELARLGAEALMQALPGIADGSRVPEAQDPAGVTYARKIAKAEAAIDWSQSAEQLARRIRAFNPWPVCDAGLDGERVRFWHAHSLPDADAAALADAPGTVMCAGPDGIDIATADGVLRVTELQAPNRKRLSAAAFANGVRLDGARFT